MIKAAVIDIGTLKCKFIVGSLDKNNQVQIIHQDKIVTLLGLDMDKNNGNITNDGIEERLIQTLQIFKKEIESQDIKKI